MVVGKDQEYWNLFAFVYHKNQILHIMTEKSYVFKIMFSKIKQIMKPYKCTLNPRF